MLNTIKNRINHHNVGLKLFTKLDLETKVNKNIGNKKRSNVNQESYKGIVNVIVIVHYISHEHYWQVVKLLKC